jgi:UDP-N-acetylglucosamine 1-carboxyvinyltransferase
MRWLEVENAGPLFGKVKVPGSKNSTLGMLAASCLCNEVVTLKNVPDILDYKYINDIGQEIGLKLHKSNECITIDPRGINSSDISPEKSTHFRTAYYFAGALLDKFKKVTIGYPGGDNFGSRPIDQHFKGLRAMGAEITLHKDYYSVEAEKLIGADIYFDLITSGGTINLMLSGVKAKGKTILRNAARDPEVVDTAILLNKMGARIRGAGTSVITIEGVDYLKGCEHTVMPDRLIAGSFLMSAGVTGGSITIEEIIPEHLESCILKLEETGLNIEIGENYISATGGNPIKGVNVKTGMYPGFGTDYQQPLTSMLSIAESESRIVDTIYPERFNNCIQLNRMGADIILKKGYCVIPGRRTLKGTWVHATDIRAGMCLIMAGMSAEGITYITGVEHIERGYAGIIDAYAGLGARIKLIERDIEAEGIDNLGLLKRAEK